MDGPPITVHALVNDHTYCSTLIDCGNLSYCLVSRSFAQRARLERLRLPYSRPVVGVNDAVSYVNEVAKFTIDLNGFSETLFAYVMPNNLVEPIMLGRPWMNRNHVTIAPAKKSIYIHTVGLRIFSREGKKHPLELKEIGANAFKKLLDQLRERKKKNDQEPIQVFAASLADINKVLAPKPRISLDDIKKMLPEHLRHHASLFDPKEANVLPPHRKGVDHAVELVEKDGRKPQAPWGPLYNMSRGELLALRQELTSLLDKGFIRTSNSPAASPVLFAKKPGGGLRMCIDYRALNALTKRDRYPLPLIQETLNNVAKAKWFTKLDVIAAFHKVRVREGDEWMTAFRTRFGLYEWLVTPFGMANSPSTFQRYINWVLRDYLDAFCTAYLDDVLIYTNGSLREHRRQVDQVLGKLKEAGLFVDIKKCEFEVKTTKYLGFIIEAGKGIRMDPAKVQAIVSWQAPTTVKGVRSFLGFANFYRRFIKNFAGLATPLTRLTGDVSWRWTTEEQEAFDELKKKFISEPILAHFRHDRDTVMECDSSGSVTGGVLSQYDDEGILRPCAYFSRKNSPAECNYEIHDKELLAVIRGLEEWDAELRSVEKFTVITDHKNLEYFMKPRRLNERQVRWSATLSQYNMQLLYRPGKENVRADALSRREQDLPADDNDERLRQRIVQVLVPTTRYYELLHGDPDEIVVMCGRALSEGTEETEDTEDTEELADEVEIAQQELGNLVEQDPTPVERSELELQWDEAIRNDRKYQDARNAVEQGERRFPVALRLKCSITECSVVGNVIMYRNRKWVPSNEPLRTRLVEDIHTSMAAGHPGREITYKMLARDYFWPGMSETIRRYLRNCDTCGRTKPWRDGLQGLLKPLPVPERIWKEISMDFIEGLPVSDGKTILMVVTDRLSKDVVFIPLANMETETVVRAFIQHVVAYHWLPDACVSDRGSQFVSTLWTRLCSRLKINRRLSTAFHPQTDGSTERMNSVWEAYMRAFVNWAQDDWAPLCPMAMIAIKGREATSTKVSPFFLQHGYNVDPIQLETGDDAEAQLHGRQRTDQEKADSIVSKLRTVFELAQASMAEAQQEQERQGNRRRREARQLRVGDKVWLRLDQQLNTGRPSRKLDHKSAKYTVTQVVDSHSVKLNTPPGIHNVFHVDRLRLASTDPLPTQTRDDYQPAPIQVEDGEEWYQVEEIMAELRQRRGRGWTRWYEVKWVGYQLTSMEPVGNLDENEAVDRWEEYTRPYRNAEGELPPGFRRDSEERHPDLPGNE